MLKKLLVSLVIGTVIFFACFCFALSNFTPATVVRSWGIMELNRPLMNNAPMICFILRNRTRPGGSSPTIPRINYFKTRNNQNGDFYFILKGAKMN
jgi:hypothetical protein